MCVCVSVCILYAYILYIICILSTYLYVCSVLCIVYAYIDIYV